MRTKIAAKALCVLLLICIMSQLAVFGTVATTVTDEYDLADALMAGGNVTLGGDVELCNETITVYEDTVLDLNGHTVFTESGFTDLFYLSEGVSPSSQGRTELPEMEQAEAPSLLELIPVPRGFFLGH